jgi:hypothetical protein
MTMPHDKVHQSRTAKIVMVACVPVVVAIEASTQGWGWPMHQRMMEAALLVPVLAYGLTRLWFTYRSPI